MELATNKHMLLASPDAGVVTDLTDPEGVDKWSGENRNSAIALNTETDEVMPLVSELEQIEKMQRQLSRMQQDTATLQAALHHKMSRVWVDSNPDRPDQSIVSRSETADNRCPKNLGQPFNKACLDPGTADLRIMQDNDTNHLWPGLVTQGLDLPERLHRPPLSSRHPNHPSGYEAPSEEEADTAQALLQLAGASEGGTRLFGPNEGGPLQEVVGYYSYHGYIVCPLPFSAPPRLLCASANDILSSVQFSCRSWEVEGLL